MIYITGDCHADFRRFEKRRFREQEGMTKVRNLEKHGGKVDYVITHCLPTSIQARFSAELYKTDILTDYLDLIERSAEYRRWYCGHYHINERILDKVEILYEVIAKIH